MIQGISAQPQTVLLIVCSTVYRMIERVGIARVVDGCSGGGTHAAIGGGPRAIQIGIVPTDGARDVSAVAEYDQQRTAAYPVRIHYFVAETAKAVPRGG